MPARLWDRASRLPAPSERHGADGHPADSGDRRRRAEIVALASGLPTIADLFTFMRDAELRFSTLRMRIEQRTATADGERLVSIEALVRHPGDAKVTTTEVHAQGGARADYEIWISDGTTVRTYAARHRLGTTRPVRAVVAGLADPDLPGSSKVYTPLTALPMETLPDTFVHPAGFCQNVLATGRCWVAGTSSIGGRETIVLECDHPRGTEVWTDRPDYHLVVHADRDTGVILRLVESIAGGRTREAEAVVFEPNAALAPTAFDFEFPADTTTIY